MRSATGLAALAALVAGAGLGWRPVQLLMASRRLDASEDLDLAAAATLARHGRGVSWVSDSLWRAWVRTHASELACAYVGVADGERAALAAYAEILRDEMRVHLGITAVDRPDPAEVVARRGDTLYLGVAINVLVLAGLTEDIEVRPWVAGLPVTMTPNETRSEEPVRLEGAPLAPPYFLLNASYEVVVTEDCPPGRYPIGLRIRMLDPDGAPLDLPPAIAERLLYTPSVLVIE